MKEILNKYIHQISTSSSWGGHWHSWIQYHEVIHVMSLSLKCGDEELVELVEIGDSCREMNLASER